KLSIKLWERTLMFATFIVMAAIELSLLIDKPNARYFAVTILAVGLILRGLVLERRMKKEAKPAFVPEKIDVDLATPAREPAPAIRLSCQSCGCRDNSRSCRDARSVAAHSRCAATKRVDQSSSRQCDPRSFEFAPGRNRSARLCLS